MLVGSLPSLESYPLPQRTVSYFLERRSELLLVAIAYLGL